MSLTRKDVCTSRPRVLYFGSDQIFWECTERVAAEITPMLDKESKTVYKVASQDRRVPILVPEDTRMVLWEYF
jgi:hypothetical protein